MLYRGSIYLFQEDVLYIVYLGNTNLNNGGSVPISKCQVLYTTHFLSKQRGR